MDSPFIGYGLLVIVFGSIGLLLLALVLSPLFMAFKNPGLVLVVRR